MNSIRNVVVALGVLASAAAAQDLVSRVPFDQAATNLEKQLQETGEKEVEASVIGEEVLVRLDGGSTASLASAGAMEQALAMRGDDLLYFCVNAEPLRPLLSAVLEREAQRDPGAATALAMLDVDSLRSVAGHLAVGGEGLELEVALDLEEGHQNLAFNLLRMPSVRESTLELVPRGAAFFLATALNEARPVAAGEQDPDAEVVSLMDFGRELFGNVADVALFGLPSTSASPQAQIAHVASWREASANERCASA